MMNLLKNLPQMSIKISDGVMFGGGIIIGAIGALLTLWLLPERSSVELAVFVSTQVILAFLVLKFFIRYIDYIATKKMSMRQQKNEKSQIPATHTSGKLSKSILSIILIFGTLALITFIIYVFSAVFYFILDVAWAIRFAAYVASVSSFAVIASVVAIFLTMIVTIAWEYRVTLVKELNIHVRSADPREKFFDHVSAIKITNHN